MDRGNMAAVLLQNEDLPCSSLEALDSLWMPNSSPPPPTPPPFHGGRIVNFSDGQGANGKRGKGDNSFFSPLEKEENGNSNDENYDGCCFHQPEKKRRLTTDQVHFLEKSFEVENKLEPERKVQLAKELGLQPRQVAIWFQNRRARYKTKQLEKEYDCLKSSYDKLNADYDSLFKENQTLKNEVQLLAEKLLLRNKGKAKSESAEKKQPNSSAISHTPNVNDNDGAGSSSAIKQELEAASSAKSDVFDSDSPHCATDGHHSSLLELEADHDSSDLVLEADRRSDFSQEEDNDSLSRSLIQSLPYSYPPSSICFPKLEDDDECYHEIQPNSFHLFPIEDQAPTWFWPY